MGRLCPAQPTAISGVSEPDMWRQLSLPIIPHPRICLIPVSALISPSAHEEGYLTISSLPPKTKILGL